LSKLNPDDTKTLPLHPILSRKAIRIGVEGNEEIRRWGDEKDKPDKEIA
jgi:hypothetical protein